MIQAEYYVSGDVSAHNPDRAAKGWAARERLLTSNCSSIGMAQVGSCGLHESLAVKQHMADGGPVVICQNGTLLELAIKAPLGSCPAC